MEILEIVLALNLIAGAVLGIYNIGKEREPITTHQAVLWIVLTVIYIYVILN